MFSLTGASGAGKSTLLERLQHVDWGVPVSCVEFDSIGVPEGADTAWRHGAIEQWVQRALAEQAEGRHMLLCGQVPMGELLAAPSADQLDGIAFCVLDCSPDSRRERLRARGWPEDGLIHHVRFGEWFVAHAQDPQHAPDVITVDSGVPMRWDRWADWRAGDPRWNATIINTDEHSIDETAALVESWVRAELERAEGGST